MNTKWTAQELLDSLNRETNQEELHELFKAIIAFECGATEIDNEALEELLDWYYDNDTLTSIVSAEILDKFQEILEKK